MSETYPFIHSYSAIYDYTKDPMEKIYNYRFVIYDSNDTEAYDSGWLLHDATEDNSVNLSIDTYNFIDDLNEGEIYQIQYQAITVNGLMLNTPKYKITMPEEMVSPYAISLTAENNYDNGYVALIPKGSGYDSNDATKEEYLSGQFCIYRCNVKTPKRWELIFKFVLQQQQPSTNILKDFTVEHGETYKYKLCQFNEADIIALSSYSNEVYVDFEDMFLFDGTRQLKIQYNPKVSSFKNDILESKLDTIGSQYPFFFRNGHVHYKEFPVSGLISYWVDNEELFKPLSDIGIKDIDGLVRRDEIPSNKKTTDLVNYNIAAERQFKLDVLEWLTNGKPKLFRSPAEGNYIVRLMNTSLTPTDSLGRMLHTFSSTAYEIDDINYNNLQDYGFISTDLSTENTVRLRFRTLRLKDLYQNINNSLYTIQGSGDDAYIELLIDPRTGVELTAQSVLIEDCEYGDVFEIDGQTTMIGVTQSYNLDNLHPIKSIKFYPAKVAAIGRETDPFADIDESPQITYSYYGGFSGISLFDMIKEIKYETVPARQFTRANLNKNVYDTNGVLIKKPIIDIIGEIEDIKTTVTKYYEVQFEKRPVETIYSAVKWDYLQSHINELTDDFIRANFSFDKTGATWGNEEDIVDFIQQTPFYLYHVEPISIYDFKDADTIRHRYSSESGIFTNYTYDFRLVDKNAKDASLFINDDKLIQTRQYYTKNEDGEYVKYNRETLPDVPVYARMLVDQNGDEFPNNLYYVDASYIDDPAGYFVVIELNADSYEPNTYYIKDDDNNYVLAQNDFDSKTIYYEKLPNYYLQYSNHQFTVFEESSPTGEKFSTKIYINTADNDVLKYATQQQLNKLHFNHDSGNWEDAGVEGAVIDVADSIQPILYHNLDKINNLYIGNGVLATLSYQTAIVTYSFESEPEVAGWKYRYEYYLNLLQQARKNYTSGDDPDFVKIKPSNIDSKYKAYFKNDTTAKTRAQWVLDSYNDFIIALNARINEWKEENGVND